MAFLTTDVFGVWIIEVERDIDDGKGKMWGKWGMGIARGHHCVFYRHNFLVCISFFENTDFRTNRLINSLLQQFTVAIDFQRLNGSLSNGYLYVTKVS